jgi:methylmalonyl-CoA/ethylmalonyl-CoA epimerase
MEFHHIGVFVQSLELGIEHLGNTIKVDSISERIDDPIIDVAIVFLKDHSGITYELVAPLSNESPVTGVLKRGNGFLNHLAYESDQFDFDVSRLRKNQNVPLGLAKPAEAFNGKRVIFFLNKLNFIIEVIEK